jgi:hypothetical protein
MSKRRLLVAAIAGALVIFAVLGAPRLRRQWVIYQTISRGLAKHACSCMFVSRRTLDACLDDLPGADQLDKIGVRFQIDSTDPGRSVTTTVFRVFRGQATYEEGAGCTQY